MRLREMLPRSWKVDRSVEAEGGVGAHESGTNGAIELRDARGVGVIVAVQAKRSFEPRQVATLSAGLSGVIRSLAGYIPVLVVAPWIGPRAQVLLAQADVNYLDLTGNVLLKLDNPALYVRTVGAARNPQPPPRGRATLRGAKAGRLIRLLLDVRPPYAVGELAHTTELAPGYVSRLLDALDREALIERSRRGRVESVEAAGLLRRWAGSYDVFKANAASTFLAPRGAAETLARIADLAASDAVAVTGSFAAVRLAPVAAPALLLAYSKNVDDLVRTLGLLPADEGADIAFLRAFDPVVWERTSAEGGVGYVAPSQVAVDCLTGTGRMPAEGEALLAWMAANEDAWRIGSLARLGSARVRA